MRRGLLVASAALALCAGAGAAGILILGNAADGEPHLSLPLELSRGEPGRSRLPPGRAARYINNQLVSDLALMEESPDGLLPKIGEDRRTPMSAYGARFAAPGGRPRIAVVVTGLGISDSGTALALSRLPPEATLSFVTTASDLQILIDQARGGGHEVLLDVPMEPFDFPDSDPGPNALLVGAEAPENSRRLQRHLSRATGYVGIANLMGGRFLGETKAIAPILDIVAQRGLLFFDNGQNASSVAITAARHAKAPIAIGNVVLDEVQSAAGIDARLSELEMQARQNGSAIGTASVYPITIERLAEWAMGLEARGFALAPLTAVTTRPQAATP